MQGRIDSLEVPRGRCQGSGRKETCRTSRMWETLFGALRREVRADGKLGPIQVSEGRWSEVEKGGAEEPTARRWVGATVTLREAA